MILQLRVIERIDFKDFFINGIFGFLLFAGALGIKTSSLKQSKMGNYHFRSVLNACLHLFLLVFYFYGVALLFGWHIDLIYCILFGALISPDDPIAVLAIIKNLKAPKRLSMQVEGESLF